MRSRWQVVAVLLVAGCDPSPEATPEVAVAPPSAQEAIEIDDLVELEPLIIDHPAPGAASLRLRNRSAATLNNVALVATGALPARTAAEIARLTRRDSQAATAQAIYELVKDARYHGKPAFYERQLHNPAVLMGTFGYGFCDDAASAVYALATLSGLPARVVGLDGHVVAEIQYDGAWHLFDPDHEVIYLAGDHVASLDEINELGLTLAAVDHEGLDPVGYSAVELAAIQQPPNKVLSRNFYFHDQTGRYGLRIGAGETITLRRAGATDGFFAERTDAPRPPLHHVYDATGPHRWTPADAQRIEVAEGPQPIVGMRVHIPGAAAAASRVTLDIEAPGLDQPVRITPALQVAGADATLSWSFQDLPTRVPLYGLVARIGGALAGSTFAGVEVTVTRQIATLSLPALHTGENRLSVHHVRTANDPRPSLQAWIEPGGGPASAADAASSKVSLDRPWVAADGNHFAWLRIELRDGARQPLPDRRVVVTADRAGVVIDAAVTDAAHRRGTSDSTGRAAFRVRATQVGSVTLTASLPDEGDRVIGSARLTLR